MKVKIIQIGGDVGLRWEADGVTHEMLLDAVPNLWARAEAVEASRDAGARSLARAMDRINALRAALVDVLAAGDASSAWCELIEHSETWNMAADAARKVLP